LFWLAGLASTVNFQDSDSNQTAQAGTSQIQNTSINSAAPIPVISGNKIINAKTNRRFVPRGVSWTSLE
jgi:hypothetical protein